MENNKKFKQLSDLMFEEKEFLSSFDPANAVPSKSFEEALLSKMSKLYVKNTTKPSNIWSFLFFGFVGIFFTLFFTIALYSPGVFTENKSVDIPAATQNKDKVKIIIEKVKENKSSAAILDKIFQKMILLLVPKK